MQPPTAHLSSHNLIRAVVLLVLIAVALAQVARANSADVDIAEAERTASAVTSLHMEPHAVLIDTIASYESVRSTSDPLFGDEPAVTSDTSGAELEQKSRHDETMVSTYAWLDDNSVLVTNVLLKSRPVTEKNGKSWQYVVLGLHYEPAQPLPLILSRPFLDMEANKFQYEFETLYNSQNHDAAITVQPSTTVIVLFYTMQPSNAFHLFHDYLCPLFYLFERYYGQWNEADPNIVQRWQHARSKTLLLMYEKHAEHRDDDVPFAQLFGTFSESVVYADRYLAKRNSSVLLSRALLGIPDSRNNGLNMYDSPRQYPNGDPVQSAMFHRFRSYMLHRFGLQYHQQEASIALLRSMKLPVAAPKPDGLVHVAFIYRTNDRRINNTWQIQESIANLEKYSEFRFSFHNVSFEEMTASPVTYLHSLRYMHVIITPHGAGLTWALFNDIPSALVFMYNPYRFDIHLYQFLGMVGHKVHIIDTKLEDITKWRWDALVQSKDELPKDHVFSQEEIGEELKKRGHYSVWKHNDFAVSSAEYQRLVHTIMNYLRSEGHRYIPPRTYDLWHRRNALAVLQLQSGERVHRNYPLLWSYDDQYKKGPYEPFGYHKSYHRRIIVRDIYFLVHSQEDALWWLHRYVQQGLLPLFPLHTHFIYLKVLVSSSFYYLGAKSYNRY